MYEERYIFLSIINKPHFSRDYITTYVDVINKVLLNKFMILDIKSENFEQNLIKRSNSI